jgi:hypothetical protein
MSEVKEVQFDGPCPFLTCGEKGPHSHPVCPECGAVRYGNLFCETCRQNRSLIDAEINVSMETAGE